MNMNWLGAMKNRRWISHESGTTLYILFLGQLVSFSLALAAFTASLIANLGVDAPIFQASIAYLALAVVYISILIFRRQKLVIPWYWYLLLGFVDVQGNCLINKAYQFTSITSVSLLDCFAVAWVMVLTWLALGTRYSLWQIVGAVVCVGGLAMVLFSDTGVGDTSGGTNPLLGDTLVVIGTVFFALSNVGEEFCVKKKDRVEVVAMIGFYGLLVSVVEISVVEREAVASIEWSTDMILSLAAYTLAIFMFYTFAPFVLQLSGATFFNLSILTADMWAVVARIFFYEQEVKWLYYVAFAMVVIGLIIYSVTEKAHVSVPALEDRSLYQVLIDESEAWTDHKKASSSRQYKNCLPQ